MSTHAEVSDRMLSCMQGEKKEERKTNRRSLSRLVSLMKLVKPLRRAALVSALGSLALPGREKVMVEKH